MTGRIDPREVIFIQAHEELFSGRWDSPARVFGL